MKCATVSGGRIVPSWPVKQPMAASLRSRAAAGSGTRRARSHGTRGSAGRAQCHAQIGNRATGDALCGAGVQRGASGRLVVAVRVVLPGGQGGVEAADEPVQPGGQVRGVHPGVRHAEPDDLARGEVPQRGAGLRDPRRGDVGGVEVRMGRLVVGDGHQPDVRAESSEQAAGAEDLVVGVGCDDHDAAPAGEVQGGQVAQPRPGAPAGLCGAERVDRVHQSRPSVSAPSAAPEQ
ncbi:hypothetical protein ACTIVE_9161 [Actinomadura verrucosospora]|uniref:Uncharacterized protein n=1 Tax=Actinomadura verrucosospora TaxID=46165 RepID=A0A7D4A327_ACTVE|nr:hypothetical protein ACTIVE_9161 [Actinomadura verrucosospora]